MVARHLGAWVTRAGGGSDSLCRAHVHLDFIQCSPKHDEMGFAGLRDRISIQSELYRIDVS